MGECTISRQTHIIIIIVFISIVAITIVVVFFLFSNITPPLSFSWSLSSSLSSHYYSYCYEPIFIHFLVCCSCITMMIVILVILIATVTMFCLTTTTSTTTTMMMMLMMMMRSRMVRMMMRMMMMMMRMMMMMMSRMMMMMMVMMMMSRMVHQWIRSAIRDSQQPASPTGLLFLKLPSPPCAVLLVMMFGFNFDSNRLAELLLDRPAVQPAWVKPPTTATTRAITSRCGWWPGFHGGLSCLHGYWQNFEWNMEVSIVIGVPQVSIGWFISWNFLLKWMKGYHHFRTPP